MRTLGSWLLLHNPRCVPVSLADEDGSHQCACLMVHPAGIAQEAIVSEHTSSVVRGSEMQDVSTDASGDDLRLTLGEIPE